MEPDKNQIDAVRLYSLTYFSLNIIQRMNSGDERI